MDWYERVLLYVLAAGHGVHVFRHLLEGLR